MDYKLFLRDLITHLKELFDAIEHAEKFVPMIADHEARLESIKSEIDHHEQVKMDKRSEMDKLREQMDHDKKVLFDDFDIFAKDTYAKMKEKEAQILAELDPLHELHNTLTHDVQTKKLELSSLEERCKIAQAKLDELKGV